MSVFTYSTKEKRAPGYGCVAGYINGGPTCQMMSSAPVDVAVTELFLAAVTPAQVDVTLRALDVYEAEQAEVKRQRQMQIQQADYEVEIARRRYEATDPANRLVAAELETRWEQALRERERLTREANELDRQAASPLGRAERRRIREMAADLRKVWHARTTGMEDRKELLRFLVHRVYLDGVTETGQIRIEVEWHTGARTQVKVARPLVGAWAPKTPAAAVERIRTLLPSYDYVTIAKKLNAEGFRTAKGLKFDYYSVGYIVRSRGWGRRAEKQSRSNV
jgi:hypothetical protein